MKKYLLRFLGAASCAALAVSTIGCDDGYDFYDGSSIVFGIEQSTDPDGKTTTSAGYEYLSLANHGGWSTVVESLHHDDVCIVEDLDHRVGRPNVGDGGRARFSGGTLPGEGLLIDANGEDAKVDGAAWTKGDSVAFSVDFGFGLPDVGVVPLLSPTVDLTVTTPPEGELAIAPATDLDVEWTSEDAEPASRVMVAFETEDAEGRGRELRCFFDEREKHAVVPASSLVTLGPPGTKGKVQLATHRQVNVFARGGWIVYVVGTVRHREQPFVVK